MMTVMFKAFISVVIAACILYQADQHFYEGRHADAIVSLGWSVVHSVGL